MTDLIHGPIYLQGMFPHPSFSCPMLMCLVGAGAHRMGSGGLTKALTFTLYLTVSLLNVPHLVSNCTELRTTASFSCHHDLMFGL